MLISERMKHEKFTDSEKIIIDYMLEHKDEIRKKSTREIARVLYCSPSSIVRLCQKLGFSGFDDFKTQYLEELEYLNSNFHDVNPNEPFDATDSIQNISQKISTLYHEIIEDTLSLLSHDQLRKALDFLLRNKNIYIVTSSSQTNIANTFKDKMSRIGKHVHVFQHTDEAFYEASYVTPGETCYILISYTGETKNCIKIARKLNERNISFITITSYGPNTLSSISNNILYVSTREKIRNNLGSYSMTLATLYLFDVLYSVYFSQKYEDNKKRRIEISREYELEGTHVERDTTNEMIK